jgi:hypothetical protein
MSLFKGNFTLSLLLVVAVLASAGNRAAANGPTFLVSISNTTPRLSEMMEVDTSPFGTNVISTTNAGIIYINTAPWSAMAFSTSGTLYGITLDSGLASIDPSTGAFSVITNLHLVASASGFEESVTGAGLALSSNGTVYVSDGFDLYTVNLASGLCSNIGTFSQLGSIGPTPVFALAAAPDGTMFGLFVNLYTVNPTNAQATQIGAAFPFGGGNSPIYATGAAFGSDGNLYMVGWNSAHTNHPKLYQVNTNDGTVTALGSLPLGAQGLVALRSSNGGAPAIVNPPTHQTVMAGDTVTFSLTGRGTPAPEVQWYFGSAEEPAATNSAFSITNASPTNAGGYFAVLSNANGTATSAVVTLTVTAPILASAGSMGDFTNSILGLTTNPPTETVLLGSNLFFSNLSFAPQGELFAMGVSPGKTNVSVNALYVISTSTWTTNFIGNFQTNGVAGQKTTIGLAFSPSGVLFASFGGSLYTVDTNTAQASTVGTFSNGIAVGGIAFAPDGTLYGGETNLYTINPTNASATKVASLNGVSASILADMKYGADGFLYFCDGNSDGNLYRLNPATAQVSVAASYPSVLAGLAFVPIPTFLMAEPTNQIATNGATTSFSVTATGAAPLEFQWFFDSVAVRGGTDFVLSLTNALARNDGTYFVVVSNSLGPVTSSIVTLTTFTPPIITKPPKAEVITPGQTIALSVEATGSALEYQWQLDGTNLPGKTAASLIVPEARTNQAGAYTIMVSNPFEAAPASASASVAVIPRTPEISTPVNNSITGASNLTVTGREPANGGAASILYQLNGGSAQFAAISSNGLTWSAAVTLAPGSNEFLVWATNTSGVSDTVKARYILNPFIPVAGAYYGLFTDGVSPAFTNSGDFNLTLESDRVFSGAILLDGARTSFTGRFDTNGLATVVAGNAQHRVYDVALQLDLSGVNPLTGSISNTTQAWTAPLSAIRGAFGGTMPATNFEGYYLLAINGASNAAAAPAGYSYATARISATGSVSLIGTMADGAFFTDTGTAISQDGDWPLYGSLFSGKGLVLAWVRFPMHSASSQITSGQALWFETAGTGSHYFTNGFSLLTNQLNLTVNRYITPARGVAVLPSVNYAVQIFGGNLDASLSDDVTISSNNAVFSMGLNTNKLSIIINAAEGTFSGSFVSPGASVTTALKGVLLPDNNTGVGYFLGTNQAGGILIQP